MLRLKTKYYEQKNRFPPWNQRWKYPNQNVRPKIDVRKIKFSRR